MAPWWLIGLLVFALPSAASADDLGDLGDDYWDVIETSSIKELMALDGIARFEDNAPLWDYHDDALQKKVDRAPGSLENRALGDSQAIESEIERCGRTRDCVRKLAPGA